MPPALIEYGWLWLLCSFQGPSERATRAYAGTVAGDGRRGLSKLNSMHGLELGQITVKIVRAHGGCLGT